MTERKPVQYFGFGGDKDDDIYSGGHLHSAAGGLAARSIRDNDIDDHNNIHNGGVVDNDTAAAVGAVVDESGKRTTNNVGNHHHRRGEVEGIDNAGATSSSSSSHASNNSSSNYNNNNKQRKKKDKHNNNNNNNNNNKRHKSNNNNNQQQHHRGGDGDMNEDDPTKPLVISDDSDHEQPIVNDNNSHLDILVNTLANGEYNSASDSAPLSQEAVQDLLNLLEEVNIAYGNEKNKIRYSRKIKALYRWTLGILPSTEHSSPALRALYRRFCSIRHDDEKERKKRLELSKRLLPYLFKLPEQPRPLTIKDTAPQHQQLLNPSKPPKSLTYQDLTRFKKISETLNQEHQRSLEQRKLQRKDAPPTPPKATSSSSKSNDLLPSPPAAAVATQPSSLATSNNNNNTNNATNKTNDNQSLSAPSQPIIPEHIIEDEERVVTMPVGTPIPLSALMKKNSTPVPSDATSSKQEPATMGATGFQLDAKLLESLIPNERESQMIKDLATMTIPSPNGETTPMTHVTTKQLIAAAGNPTIVDDVRTLYNNQTKAEHLLLAKRATIMEQLALKRKEANDEFQILSNQANDMLIKNQIYNNYLLTDKMLTDETENILKQITKDILIEMNQQILLQQTKLQQHGVAGFFPTKNLEIIKCQTKLLRCLFPYSII
ncbi:hypothetical protein SAMD00019534_064980 [Acytostelium subglobosum LB1]|uniref:hypothetical protein n=1 Tax=Acytostelium subglobosum LB1 TaxID=1410327 RepID=UPI0006449F1F|nr:hypothetical protein SAMD00019534_064980 [Acytostelium subglobosum LB1]GAM23323.1 hypothetical protein SAMD00019534_064980 [Acytostelium subglobosum LB1]|eukprot:XP_012753772.1 hypothetical protein SAMD00019534_064980 [Acytostelium subglobosum LB1]